MADVFLFIRHSWKNIWKQKTIWLFSSFYLFGQFSYFFRYKKEWGLFVSFIFLALNILFLVLFFISDIGVPYLAYCFLIGKSVTIQETLFAVRKFLGRVLGCSCLGLLLLSPLMFWILAVSINSSTHTIEFSDKTMIPLLLGSTFAALPQFTMVVFFENDWGIRKSIEKAWNLFISHFGVLAMLGLILAIILKVYSAATGILTVLIQSGFDITSISKLNLFNPSASLNRNILFLLLNGIGLIIYIPFSASIFISAYLKYSDVKLPFLMRVR